MLAPLQLALCQILLDVYPKAGGVDALRPDRLGERFIVAELSRDPGLLRAVLELEATTRERSHVLAVLERIWTREELAPDSEVARAIDEGMDQLFRLLRPRTARILDKAIQRIRDKQESGTVQGTQARIQSALAEAGMTTQVIWRQRSTPAVYSLMKQKSVPLAHVMGILDFEIITPEELDCYVAQGVVSQTFRPVPGTFKDYTAIPASSGYRALHLTVITPHGLPLSIRILSQAMKRYESLLPEGPSLPNSTVSEVPKRPSSGIPAPLKPMPGRLGH
ncbi:MAG: hypothetical protein QM742_17350 [Aquabacterium sp.]